MVNRHFTQLPMATKDEMCTVLLSSERGPRSEIPCRIFHTGHATGRHDPRDGPCCFRFPDHSEGTSLKYEAPPTVGDFTAASTESRGSFAVTTVKTCSGANSSQSRRAEWPTCHFERSANFTPTTSQVGGVPPESPGITFLPITRWKIYSPNILRFL